MIDADVIHSLADAISQASSFNGGLALATLAHVIWQQRTLRGVR